MLLARWTGPRGPEWTLPGGGLDFGEDPADAAVREVREETGYTVRLDELLFVNSFRRVLPDAPVDFHAIQIVYTATVIGGELCHEIGGVHRHGRLAPDRRRARAHPGATGRHRPGRALS